MQLVLAIIDLSLLAGLLWSLWYVLGNPRRRARHIAAELSAPLVSESAPLSVGRRRWVSGATAAFFALFAVDAAVLESRPPLRRGAGLHAPVSTLGWARHRVGALRIWLRQWKLSRVRALSGHGPTRLTVAGLAAALASFLTPRPLRHKNERTPRLGSPPARRRGESTRLRGRRRRLVHRVRLAV